MTNLTAALVLLAVAAFPLACYLAAKMGAVGWFVGRERVRDWIKAKRREEGREDQRGAGRGRADRRAD